MSFSFDCSQTLSSLDKIYSCMDAWSKKIPMTLSKEGGYLSITIKEKETFTTMKIKEAVAVHTSTCATSYSYFDAPETTTLHYNLKLIGKKENELTSTFYATLNIDVSKKESFTSFYIS